MNTNTQTEEKEVLSQVFCKDCKHRTYHNSWSRCKLTEVRDPVFGESSYTICQEERDDDNGCGSTGKFFEPIPPPPPALPKQPTNHWKWVTIVGWIGTLVAFLLFALSRR